MALEGLPPRTIHGPVTAGLRPHLPIIEDVRLTPDAPPGSCRISLDRTSAGAPVLAEARQSQRKLSIRGSRCREGGGGGEVEMEEVDGVKNGMRV